MLRSKDSEKVLFAMQHESTWSILASHYVIDQKPYCDLKPNCACDATWVWSAFDATDTGKTVCETFALKFGSKALAVQFRFAFDSAKVSASSAM